MMIFGIPLEDFVLGLLRVFFFPIFLIALVLVVCAFVSLIAHVRGIRR